MAFADWVKRSNLAATELSKNPRLRHVLQAAYKAGERQGRADVERLAKSSVGLAEVMRARQGDL